MENQEVGKPKKSRAKYEVIILLVVIAAALVAGVSIYKMRVKADKSKLLLSELEQMRSAITTYKTLNKVLPPDLEGLVKLTYSFTSTESPKPYLPNAKLNPAGKLVDPFGNVYKYDVAKGWVSSSTTGYTDW